jgi:hypothetical protein
VPTHVFTPVNVPLYRVYFLLCPNSSKLKIGFSGGWLRRAAQFGINFDLDRSIGIDFGGDKPSARAAEKMAHSIFKWARTEPPKMQFGAYGRTEWFSAIILNDAAAEISAFNMRCRRGSLTLRNALVHDLREDSDVSFPYPN